MTKNKITTKSNNRRRGSNLIIKIKALQDIAKVSLQHESDGVSVTLQSLQRSLDKLQSTIAHNDFAEISDLQHIELELLDYLTDISVYIIQYNAAVEQLQTLDTLKCP
jgi:hypothetical protein